MLRLETDTGWWLVTHPDHARLAGDFAARWGNEQFVPPQPRVQVLKGIACHDDGWKDRDASPQITKQGRPSAFSVELVGKYSAFEEIDLSEYLAVRDRAVRVIATESPYAAVLISMHTYNLLTVHADRSTIAPEDLPLLDRFLEQQKSFQSALRARLREEPEILLEQTSEAAILDQFRLLQATDNLSLLTCVDYAQPAHLLHPLPLRNARYAEVSVRRTGVREFALAPYPFDQDRLTLNFPSRFVAGKFFASPRELQDKFAATPVEMLSVTLRAG